MIPMIEKKDRALFKSHHPFALLSCLAKGLKRLFTRRIAFLALKNKVLGHYQCSAILKRCDIDLTIKLTSELQSAWESKQAAAMAILDVRRAFEEVLQNRLTFTLRTQG